MGLTNLFNKIRGRWDTRRETAERSKLAAQAIRSQNDSLLNSVLDMGPIEGRTDLLLGAAIDTDNVEIFKIVLAKQAGSDPNIVLSQDGGGYGVVEISNQPLIYKAILEDKPKIAGYLAANPATDITAPAGATTTVCGGGHAGMAYAVTFKSPYSTPLEAAKEKGMQDVAAILAARMSGLKASPLAPAP